MERNYDLEKRKYVIGGAVIVIVLIFLIRLLSLQIMSEDYKKNADSNAFLKKYNIQAEESYTTGMKNCWFIIRLLTTSL